MCVLGLVRYFFGLCFYWLVFSVFCEIKATKGDKKQFFWYLLGIISETYVFLPLNLVSKLNE